jgi:hypothetical protein
MLMFLVQRDGAHSIRSQLQKVTLLHVFCTSVLAFYELLNKLFSSLRVKVGRTYTVLRVTHCILVFLGAKKSAAT